MITAILIVSKGPKNFSRDVTLSMAEASSNHHSALEKESYIHDLTEREIDILKFFADGFSNK